MVDKKNFICACFFTRNIFLKKYNLHVVYKDDLQFIQDYKTILYKHGCVSDDEVNGVKEKIKQEINRRKGNGIESQNRKNIIQKEYFPCHENLYTLQDLRRFLSALYDDHCKIVFMPGAYKTLLGFSPGQCFLIPVTKSYLHPDFVNIVEYVKTPTSNRDGLLQLLHATEACEVFRLPIFTSSFCESFIEELKHFEGSNLPKGRPNSMNDTGILLEELGFYSKFVNPLREEYLSPIASLLYPDWVGKGGLDSQRAFVVSYHYDNNKDDTDLNLHFDNAEVTLNISLCDTFTCGELFFGGMRTETQGAFKQVVHQLGHGIFHRGQQFHGAMPLESGERYNLIIWMRSSSIRNILCPMCDDVPTLVETDGDGDGFTADKSVDVCNVV